jgi:hypothetical protein
MIQLTFFEVKENKLLYELKKKKKKDLLVSCHINPQLVTVLPTAQWISHSLQAPTDWHTSAKQP